MIISMKGVSKSFARNIAVNNIDLQITEGEILGLVGPDGAGKTTIMRMLTGIVDPERGEIQVLGSSNLESIKGSIGYIPQKFSLYGDLTVMENINLLGALYGQTPAKIQELADTVLSFTKLLPFKDRLANNLSGGMKQKLALATGMMHRPRILFLDEPTTGVDPVSRREFWQMLYQLNKEGTTVVVSTPYMDEAELCHRLAFMHAGRIIANDTPSQLKADYPYKILELPLHDRRIKQQLMSPAIVDINIFGNYYHLIVTDVAQAKQELQATLSTLRPGFAGEIRVLEPSLDDVFVALADEVS